MYATSGPDDVREVRLGVGVIIINDQKQILLERRSDCSMWGLPGGRVERGESISQTAIREAYEETGLTIEVTGLMGIYSAPADRIVTFPDNVVQLIDTVVTAKILSGTLQISEESEALEFFPPDNLPMDIVPPALQPLRDYAAGKWGVLD